MEIDRKHKYSTKLKNYYFVGYMNILFKGALNPNFLNLTINREKFCL